MHIFVLNTNGDATQSIFLISAVKTPSAEQKLDAEGSGEWPRELWFWCGGVLAKTMNWSFPELNPWSAAPAKVVSVLLGLRGHRIPVELSSSAQGKVWRGWLWGAVIPLLHTAHSSWSWDQLSRWFNPCWSRAIPVLHLGKELGNGCDRHKAELP